jgi:hypothetical protein
MTLNQALAASEQSRSIRNSVAILLGVSWLGCWPAPAMRLCAGW